MPNHALTLFLSLAAVASVGCEGGEKVKPVDVEIKVVASPLDQATTYLARYAAGTPMTSESSEFDGLVEKIREKDPAKADILKKGFEDLKKANPAQLRTKAAALLKQVSPNTAPPPPK